MEKDEFVPGKHAWNTLFKWSMENMDPQGSEKDSIFYGKSPEEIEKDIEWLQNVFKTTTIDIGKKLVEKLDLIKKGTLDRKGYMATLFQIEEYVENIDFADVFSRIDGLKILFNNIISNDKFEWEDIKIYSIKLIGVCLFNTKMVKFDISKLYDLVFELVEKFSKQKPMNVDYMKSLLFAINAFISTNDEVRAKFQKKLVRNDLGKIVKILSLTNNPKILQKTLHLLLAMFIGEENVGSNLLALVLSSKYDFLKVCQEKISNLLEELDNMNNRNTIEQIVELFLEFTKTKENEKTFSMIKEKFIRNKIPEVLKLVIEKASGNEYCDEIVSTAVELLKYF